jgi:hypothetical protein
MNARPAAPTAGVHPSGLDLPTAEVGAVSFFGAPPAAADARPPIFCTHKQGVGLPAVPAPGAHSSAVFSCGQFTGNDASDVFIHGTDVVRYLNGRIASRVARQSRAAPRLNDSARK